jgi:hypothetical protein
MRANTSSKGDEAIERVRRIVWRCPERGRDFAGDRRGSGKKVFAMFSNNHHHDGHIAVTVPAAIGIQEALIKKSPKKFYCPPYVGCRGWIGIEVNRVSDKELALHIKEAWRLIAPRKFLSEPPAVAGG